MGRSPNAQRLVPCMPPLLEEELKPFSKELSTYGGTACENVMKAYFLSKHINIADPHVDDGVDLLVKKPEGWVRGQVKKVVYHPKIDYIHKKNFGNKIIRNYYSFKFQGGGQPSGTTTIRRQRGPTEIDVFYHVLLTPYRQLIWETPVGLIPLREDGNFIDSKDVCLDRDNWRRKPREINFNKLLVSSRYDPIIFKTFHDFFMKPEPPTLCNFFSD